MAGNYFFGKNILVTGGLGFIGSNLVDKLVNLDANVTIVDAMLENGGANHFNIEQIKDDMTVNYSNICDKTSLRQLILDKDIVFHLAAQMSHTLGLKDQGPDIEYNIKGMISLLECCKERNNGIKIVYTGSRGQYGKVDNLPVKETSAMNPLGSHEITKLAAENFLFFYHRSHRIKTVSARLSNIYGPRAQMKSHEFGVVNWFVRLALDSQAIKLFGDKKDGYGTIKRDFLYIDDCVDALLLLASKEECIGSAFNVGNDAPDDFSTVAEVLKRQAGANIEEKDWSEERKLLEPGSFYPDISKIRSLGWSPKIGLEQGLDKTLEFYRKNKQHYW